MEILQNPPNTEAMTRERWIAAFMALCLPHERPEESDALYRDGGAGVILRFPNGGEARWHWADLEPADAAMEAHKAGWLTGVVKSYV